MLGELVGERYEIINEVGRGSVGVVYRAQDRDSGRIVALKVMECDDVEELTYKRFLRSIEATKLLCHPNVVAPEDFGFINENTPYVITEFCEGRLLSEVLRQERFLDCKRTVDIAAQICDALDHAHYFGVIHRNLKPANIMLVTMGISEQAKVLDFAVAKSFFRFTKAGQLKVTVKGEIIGTPEFMSPEQCRHLETDWRSDIYSLGCLIYTMLTGRPPIKGNTAPDTVIRQDSDPPMPFERANPHAQVPGALQEVVFRALSKDRESRQQTMVELKDDLFASVAEHATANPKPTPSKPKDEGAPNA
jgi:serine/threonine protein kinase